MSSPWNWNYGDTLPRLWPIFAARTRPFCRHFRWGRNFATVSVAPGTHRKMQRTPIFRHILRIPPHQNWPKSSLLFPRINPLATFSHGPPRPHCRAWSAATSRHAPRQPATGGSGTGRVVASGEQERRLSSMGHVPQVRRTHCQRTLKHMAHNLIGKAAGKHSFRLRRKIAAWDDDFLASLIAA
jgi:hypothetical protein